MVFRWLQSKMKAERSELEAETQTDTALVEFGPVPWTVWFDSGLVVYIDEGDDNGRAVPLDHAFLVLGRTREHTRPRPGWVLVADGTVSRRQAIIVWNSEARTYMIYHLEGATNRTYVGRKEGSSWSVGPGSLVHVGRMRFQIQQAPPQTEYSPFAGSALGLLERKAKDLAPPPRDLALTVINGPHQGCTYLLTRHFHILHSMEEKEHGQGVLRLDSCPELEQAVMGWSTSRACYQIVNNPVAERPTRVYRATPDNRKPSAIFSPPVGEAIEISSKEPLSLHYGDTLQVGEVQLRLHPYVNALLDGSIRHILSKGYIEEIPPVNQLLANVDEIAEDAGAGPPPSRKLGKTVEKTEQLETPSMKAKLERIRAAEEAAPAAQGPTGPDARGEAVIALAAHDAGGAIGQPDKDGRKEAPAASTAASAETATPPAAPTAASAETATPRAPTAAPEGAAAQPPRVLELPTRSPRAALPTPPARSAGAAPETPPPAPKRVLEIPTRKSRPSDSPPIPLPASSAAAESVPPPPVEVAESEQKPTARRTRAKKVETVEMPAPTADMIAALESLGETAPEAASGADPLAPKTRARKKTADDSAIAAPTTRKSRKKT